MSAALEAMFRAYYDGLCSFVAITSARRTPPRRSCRTTWNGYDERNVPPDKGAHSGFTYGLLQRPRGTSDALIPKMRDALGARASSSAELASALAYAGYAYVLMADHLCAAPIEAFGRPVQPDAMYTEAATRFTEAVTIAGAAGATDIANLAKIGLGRAHLNLGQHAQAVQALTGVPASFTAWLRYVPSGSLGDWQLYNFMAWWAGEKAGELDLAYEAAFRMNDKSPKRHWPAAEA